VDGGARPVNRRVVLWSVAAVVGLNLLVALVNVVAPSPGGRRSSSLATAPGGFAAWAALAQRNGVEVIPLRDDLQDARLPAGATLVALDVPGLSRADARVLRDHAAAGGRVLAGGTRPDTWLSEIAPGLRWRASGPADARVGALRVRTAGAGAWSGGRGGLVETRGRVRLLADATPLQNQRLARADNASLALELTGPGPLVFAEAAHGYGNARGLAALPAAAKGALVLLLAAAVLLMLARGRRFGPPEPERRDLAPPRAAFVDAQAATLAKTRDPARAMAPVRDALLAAGEEADPPRDDAEALGLARRHAQLTRGAR